MITLALQIGLAVAVFLAMEGVAWLMHRYLMHGVLWRLHRSHHEPRHSPFELNDVFAVVFAVPAIACFLFDRSSSHWSFAVGMGITAYGVVYALFHDGLVHRRFPMPRVPVRGFWQTRFQAHRLHHAVSTRTGCVSYGFLWALPARELKAKLVALRSAPQGEIDASHGDGVHP